MVLNEIINSLLAVDETTFQETITSARMDDLFLVFDIQQESTECIQYLNRNLVKIATVFGVAFDHLNFGTSFLRPAQPLLEIGLSLKSNYHNQVKHVQMSDTLCITQLTFSGKL